MFGFFNRLLWIDVTQKSWTVESLPDDLLKQTLGGKGLATRLLLKHNHAGVDPLSPDNHLILATGPVAGTPTWGSCRYGVFTKSPLTGYYSESYAGGTAGDYMARTGYDAFMIEGGAENPLWIEVSEEGAIFHAADDLWGLETYETEDRIKAWIGKNRPEARRCGVICIGPAGENLVRFAVIENDYWRSAGRTGVGAVMGSKNIKAIAFWGNAKKVMADSGFVKGFVRDLAVAVKDDPGVKAYKQFGTPMMVDIVNNMKCFPTRYWQKGQSDHREKINAKALHERLKVTPHACLKCFMACGRLSEVREGRHKGLKIEGPEYETIGAFGGLCEVQSIEEIAYLNDLCDRLGLDTMTAGNLASLTIEANRQGKIDYDIDYGEVDKIANLLKEITLRQGIGNILARGIKSTAKVWAMEDQAIHVKGLEPASFDPRVLIGMGLAYGTSPRGACHLRTTFYKPELAGLINPMQVEGKAEMLVEWENRLALFDALIVCRFYRDIYQWEQLSEIIKGVTGLKLQKEELMLISSQIVDDTRRFNIREGLRSEEDRLPRRFHTELLPESGQIITEGQMEQLLSDYYRARGWKADGTLADKDH